MLDEEIKRGNQEEKERFYSDILKYEWQHFEHNLIKDGLTKEESKKSVWISPERR